MTVSPMTLRLAHATATDRANGTAADPRREPWDAAAWEAACAEYLRVLGDPSPERLADLYLAARRGQ